MSRNLKTSHDPEHIPFRVIYFNLKRGSSGKSGSPSVSFSFFQWFDTVGCMTWRTLWWL